MSVEKGPKKNSSHQPAIPLPAKRIIPFAPGTIGKAPSGDALTHFQEIVEKTQTNSTLLPSDVMNTIYPKINPR